MNPSKCDDPDYIQFLIAAQKAFTCTEAARSQPQGLKDPPAHDSLTRLLTRKPPDTKLRGKRRKPWLSLIEGFW